MSEFGISVNNAYLDMAKIIQPVLTEFKEQHRAHVTLHVYDWAAAWSEFLKIGQSQQGPFISQTGNSWMGSLIAQNNLRPFKPEEIMQLNGKPSFLAGSWESCLDFDNNDIVAIPWILDTYLVYYHRDMLEKAGIDESTAFSTLESFDATLQKLQDNGLKYPFVIPALTSFGNIHTVASWVWGQGGDFTNADGTRMTLSQPETREGMKKYFDLYRFMPSEVKDMSDVESWDLFLDRKIAVTVRTQELLFRVKNNEFPSTFTDTLRTSVVPGVPLLGGSHLVIWKHLRPDAEETAIDLVKFLTSAETELTLLDDVGYIPASVRALARIPANSIYAAAVASVRRARPFRHIRMWGPIEEKLAVGLSNIWQILLSTPNPDVSQIIADQLDPIEASLNQQLLSQ